MNKIIIDPHYCSIDEYDELKKYLTHYTWDWQEVSSGEELIKKLNPTCPLCNGTGRRKFPNCTPPIDEKCPACNNNKKN